MIDELAHGGLRGGFLFALPEDAAKRLLDGAIRISVPASALIYRDGESPRVIVVISALLRVFLRSADGRQVTVRYVRDGDVAGLALVVEGLRADEYPGDDHCLGGGPPSRHAPLAACFGTSCRSRARRRVDAAAVSSARGPIGASSETRD